MCKNNNDDKLFALLNKHSHIQNIKIIKVCIQQNVKPRRITYRGSP